MDTVDNMFCFLQRRIREVKSGTPQASQDARLRYRCAHTAWCAPGDNLDGDVLQALHWAARLLGQMTLSCELAATRQQEAVACEASDFRKATELRAQAHVQALLALGAMGWLWQHCAWQLLAHPRNHIASTCLQVSQAMTSLLGRQLAGAEHAPATKAHAQLIEASVNRLCLGEKRWVALQVQSAHWRGMKQSEISLALSRLREQYNKVSEPAIAAYRSERKRDHSPDDGSLRNRLSVRRQLNRMSLRQLEHGRKTALALDAQTQRREIS